MASPILPFDLGSGGHSDEMLGALEDSAKHIIASDDQLALISRLADKYRETRSAMIDAEGEYRLAKQLHEVVAKKELPEALLAAGVRSVLTNDNLNVEYGEEVHASISKMRASEAFQWLRDNDFGGLIKNKVEARFARGKDESAVEIAAELKKLEEKYPDLKFERSEEVHNQTLKAWVKEQRKAGVFLPEDLFGIFIEKVSTVKEK